MTSRGSQVVPLSRRSSSIVCFSAPPRVSCVTTTATRVSLAGVVIVRALTVRTAWLTRGIQLFVGAAPASERIVLLDHHPCGPSKAAARGTRPAHLQHSLEDQRTNDRDLFDGGKTLHGRDAAHEADVDQGKRQP
jgi:hypothetical protein